MIPARRDSTHNTPACQALEEEWRCSHKVIDFNAANSATLIPPRLREVPRANCCSVDAQGGLSSAVSSRWIVIQREQCHHYHSNLLQIKRKTPESVTIPALSQRLMNNGQYLAQALLH
jgi:hypothetical protein